MLLGNMKPAKKQVLFAGIGLLVIGIVVRKFTAYSLTGLIMILVGVGFKTFYIISMIRSGVYKPGRELWLLFVGLALFLGGLYLRRKGFIVDPIYLILTGLALKVAFILRFIQLVRQGKPAE